MTGIDITKTRTGRIILFANSSRKEPPIKVELSRERIGIHSHGGVISSTIWEVGLDAGILQGQTHVDVILISDSANPTLYRHIPLKGQL